jgi:rhodanese-related sulfurtransferase
MIKSTDAKELKQWMDAGEAVVVDVREPSEWDHAHIDGATLIPLATVPTTQMPAHAGKKLVMQCKSGGRSRAACGILSQQIDGLEIYNLEGGIMGWIAAGYPVL